MQLKYWEIEIDGPDKTGKDLLCTYLCKLSNYKFSINVRGYMSQLVYNMKFDRGHMYDQTVISKNKIFVLLTADAKDLNIRCSATNEPKYDYDKDQSLFYDAFTIVCDSGHIALSYNTSRMTPYDIALDIIKKIDELERN